MVSSEGFRDKNTDRKKKTIRGTQGNCRSANSKPFATQHLKDT